MGGIKKKRDFYTVGGRHVITPYRTRGDVKGTLYKGGCKGYPLQGGDVKLDLERIFLNFLKKIKIEVKNFPTHPAHRGPSWPARDR